MPQEHNLPIAFLRDLSHLVENMLCIPAALSAAHIGNNAVGAKIVAAVHNRDLCKRRLGAKIRNLLRDAAILVFGRKDALLLHDPIQKLRQTIQGVRAKHQIHMGIFLLDRLGDVRLLHHASAYPDDHIRPAAFSML